MRLWPLGGVIEVHPGEDGLVRVATVKTAQGIFRCAIHKLVPLLEESSISPGGCLTKVPTVLPELCLSVVLSMYTQDIIDHRRSSLNIVDSFCIIYTQ